MAENNTGMELDGMLKALWDSLTEEQKEKARKCTSTEELMSLAGKEGIELPDEMLDAVAGGGTSLFDKHPAFNIKPAEEPTGKVTLWCPFCRYRHSVEEFNTNEQPPKKGGARDQPYRCFRCTKIYRKFFVGTIDEQIYDIEGGHWCGPSLGADLYGC